MEAWNVDPSRGRHRVWATNFIVGVEQTGGGFSAGGLEQMGGAGPRVEAVQLLMGVWVAAGP